MAHAPVNDRFLAAPTQSRPAPATVTAPPLGRVCVVGLGKMGLPLAAHYANQGCDVTGCDINLAVVEAVNRGEAHVREEPGLAERVADANAAGRLRATSDTAAAVRASDVVIVIVQVALTPERQVDYSAIDAATAAIARGLRPGMLVIYETTLPVGSTRQRFAPALERGSGLRAGEAFFLAFSPERVMSGTLFANLVRYPKIVGGINAASTEHGAAFYRRALGAPVTPLASAEAAEFTKLIETTYRDVNIALANEFARFAGEHGIDVTESIQAANSQPFSHIHQPGIGVGGHCIPVYPYFLLENDTTLELPRLARRINDGMAGYGVALLGQELGGLAGRRVLILGLAYREDVRETLFSSALALIRELTGAGAQVLLHDPLFSPEEIRRFGAEPAELDDARVVDAVILQAYHTEYRQLDFGRFRGLRVVLDGRNVLDAARVERAGARYIGIGRPTRPAPVGEDTRAASPAREHGAR